ncbi:hypothetical protein EAI_12359 [Harpegnathos saltator]|uniref:Uncharacterized protein n=1 Tax=Harpegnathos saltator TaxID=610380 RepID=E2BYC7_HARSA|nr:hypothetical protein EAI_12359 [Harpegnathos saltator]
MQQDIALKRYFKPVIEPLKQIAESTAIAEGNIDMKTETPPAKVRETLIPEETKEHTKDEKKTMRNKNKREQMRVISPNHSHMRSKLISAKQKRLLDIPRLDSALMKTIQDDELYEIPFKPASANTLTGGPFSPCNVEEVEMSPLPQSKRGAVDATPSSTEEEESPDTRPDKKVRRVVSPNPLPMTLEVGESVGALPQTPLEVDSPSSPRKEDIVEVGTSRDSHDSAEAPAIEAIAAEAPSGETEASLTPEVSQEGVDVGSPEET